MNSAYVKNYEKLFRKTCFSIQVLYQIRLNRCHAEFIPIKSGLVQDGVEYSTGFDITSPAAK